MGVPADAGTEKVLSSLCSQCLVPLEDGPSATCRQAPAKPPACRNRPRSANLSDSPESNPMIISQTPYRVSFAGGGTDLPSFLPY